MRCVAAGIVVCLGSAAAWAGAPTGVAPQTGVAQSSAAEPVAAVWKERRIDFMYMGRTARYSCDGLHDKVRAMLIDLGARRDVKIVAIGCEADDRLRVDSEQPSLNIIFSAPALPDPAAKPLRVGDLAAMDAHYEAFTITSDTFRNLGVGDCELVEEFARQILPKLVTRDVTQDITCVPFEQSGSRFLVRGEILKTLRR